MSELKLFNSLTRQLETFTPVHAGEARVYTCGPTVYNYPHIGNMRAYVFADTLGRVLSYKGYKLTHVINITDVGHLTDDADAGEDKMEKMAAEKAQSIWDIARHYTQAYWDDIKALNIRQPAHWSIATEYVPAMIAYATSIADKHCYELESGLYFDTSTVANYGALARAKTEDGEGRIEEVEGKRHAADFAIWRKTPAGETRQMEWDSPWGKGAPGWHLECSVMSEALLGLPFDIHTGGIDHREIHHPNEIAQNQARCGGDHSGAQFWMHNNFLIERSGKMSKSSGEFLRVQLLIDKGFHPLAYRLMCLQAHYRSELEFSWEGLQAAFVRLKRMVMAVSNLKARHAELVSASYLATSESKTLKHVQGDVAPAISAALKDFATAVEDDLNTAIAITSLETLIGLKKVDAAQHLAAIAEMDAVLGLNLNSLTRTDLRIRPKAAVITESEIETALTARKDARAEKDFAKSDAIRDDLIAKGVEVMDGDPLGWDWKLDV
ncbi:MAG: cysteine--tRNA ligase [Sphingomonadales bacterium 35-56-22]|jgi:cysteinyl-tRNA synthetase|uniref:cysteine--tRNA ligase n=1 Tax=Sphingorhabdus sp. TaxID=1902408 RepID=UPI000BDB2516|nr:cysteine--tRNA ligase [Sphingorhabdus sp.]OYY16575.1 MAG: cysteine--tRNA ligase [Sphingomonadales bacterium 35-56-22]OYY98341.1 MAG: cysteine--tRNA ligase [Sphingomonadales bacterium 28-56-43]OYZ60813.1 MAG: cysteine--tRNA ligase [Sphingomonadales bacterium 24-56-14]OZA83637.1 MAG: cysteine--tRNA ligase [Sphingomonadales bacterium 39-57-19]HQS12006.1 cysteine--tRNA ligase [Sphingorhabdus sp.]